MSLMGRFMAFFPLIHALLIGINLASAFVCAYCLIFLPFSIWIFPLLCWSLHNRIWPLKKGLSRFGRPEYSPWWGSYQIQYLFLLIPSFERILHIVPGLFSAWLRAWGSEIGKQVFWTPHTLILDRSLLNFGDGIIIGHRCSFSSHVISLNKAGELILFVKPIEIGQKCFIGAGSDIGPGASVDAGTRLPVESRLYPNQKVGPESSEE
ncbi:MAG: acyl transferase [Oligoflexus sp.]|nr:acyl transferase [Oligoflexus sp.]